VREFSDDERGPDPSDPDVRRRNLRTLLVLVALVALAAVFPGTCRRVASPDAAYPTGARAAEDGAVQRGAVPGLIPPDARDVRVRHDPRSGRRFIRFDYDSAGAAELTAGLRRVAEEEKARVPVPAAGWASWFPITERTLSGRQGGYLEVYEVTSGPDRGWLALDPRTRHAYYWSEGGPQ
jgi:hypothetical protein